MEHFFSEAQGNLLIRLLLAHILADFVFQSKKMVASKKWFSKQMLLHISIVFLATFLFTFLWKISLFIAFFHWCIDGIKSSIKNSAFKNEFILFYSDQLAHLLSLLIVWGIYFSIFKNLMEALSWPFANYKTSLILLGYFLLVWPSGYLLKFVLHKLQPEQKLASVEHGGKLIGQFERVIILTFVLLEQFSAIGFLITGKSIMRFADKNSDVKSEYVLVGTMASYALAILIGVCINWMQNIS